MDSSDRHLFAHDFFARDLFEFADEPLASPGCLAGRRGREDPFDRQVRRFFGRSQRELVIKRDVYPLYELPQLHQALAACFGDWRLVAEGGGREARAGALWAPETARVLVAPGQWHDYPLEATRFYRQPDGSRRVLSLEEWSDVGFRVCFLGPRSQEAALTAEHAALAKRMKQPHYLQWQVLKPGGVIYDKFQPRAWDDVALDPAVRTAIEQNTAEVFRRREAFRRNGVPLKRGLLLYGPPGTGKTLLASAVAGLKVATFVYVTAADMGDLDDVRNIFALARKLQPSIIFLEDIDLFADDRSSYSSKAVLGEVLAQLDGFEDNDGLVFIATTNDLEAIDPAVRERPSRFDVVLHLGLPGREARRAILAKNLPPEGADARLLDEASSATEGLSGAQMREVAFLALQRAILRDAVDEAGRAILAREDILAAVARLNGKQAAPIGFSRTCEE